ncbi:MAG TPA: DUF4870 domain-containing protein [Candidatus Nanoarchaeia archaeon]|nr:DUF4870 domain-containing protein [Candidatus Nanoarchaeia archaeon]
MAKKKEDDTKIYAFLATFLSIVGFVIALMAKKENKYVMFYAKQSLIIFIVYVIAVAVEMLPLIGSILGPIIYLATLVFWIFSWVYALSGNMKKVPFIGNYAEKLKL